LSDPSCEKYEEKSKCTKIEKLTQVFKRMEGTKGNTKKSTEK